MISRYPAGKNGNKRLTSGFLQPTRKPPGFFHKRDNSNSLSQVREALRDNRQKSLRTLTGIVGSPDPIVRVYNTGHLCPKSKYEERTPSAFTTPGERL